MKKIPVCKDKKTLLIAFIAVLIISSNPILGLCIYLFSLISINSDIVYTRDKEILGINTFSKRLQRFIKVTLNRVILSFTLMPYVIYFIKVQGVTDTLNFFMYLTISSLILVYIILTLVDLFTLGLRFNKEKYLRVESLVQSMKEN